MKCYIFCAAPFEDIDYIKKIDFNNSFIICADGGIEYAKRLELLADVWMGDGDSLQTEVPLAKEVIMFPVKKDYTDTDLCVQYALDKGFRDITLIGALGGRRDHEFSHFCLLQKIAKHGGKGYIIDAKNTITLEDKSFKIIPDGRKHISFFPFGGKVENFSVKGLLYETEGITLYSHEVQASSNSFVGDKAGEVTFESGSILVISSDD